MLLTSPNETFPETLHIACLVPLYVLADLITKNLHEKNLTEALNPTFEELGSTFTSF